MKDVGVRLPHFYSSPQSSFSWWLTTSLVYRSQSKCIIHFEDIYLKSGITAYKDKIREDLELWNDEFHVVLDGAFPRPCPVSVRQWD